MPSFKDKLKKIASDKQIILHPLVTKLNANQSTRSSYWLAFALYVKVEEKELDARLTELGKSLKLDDDEIKDELAAVKECESDEDFESLVQECAAGLVDKTVKFLLMMELDHFSKENSLDPDFISTLSDIIEISAEEKTFLTELKKILKSKTQDLEKFSAFLKKNSDQPTAVFELYFPELYQAATTIPDGAAEFLIQEIEKKTGPSINWVTMNLEILQVQKMVNDVEKKFKKQYPQAVLSLTRNAAFQIYKVRIGEMIDKFEKWVDSLDTDNESSEWPFDAIVFRNITLRRYFQYHMGVQKLDLPTDLFLRIKQGAIDIAGTLFAFVKQVANHPVIQEVYKQKRQRKEITSRKEAITKVREFFDNELSEMGKHYA